MTSNEFFTFITLLAIIAVAVFACVSMFYLIMILRRVHRAMDTIEDNVNSLAGGFRDFYIRTLALKETAEVIAQGVRTFLGLYQKRTPKKRHIIENEDEEE